MRLRQYRKVMPKEFRETTYLESATVDANSGVIRGVKLLGLNSRNGRRYTREALQRALPLYNDTKIYLNHQRRAERGEDRQFESWAGVVQNAEIRQDGVYGEAHLRKESPFFRGLVEAATRFPKSFGFSHVADGDSRMEGGTEVVESISAVESVDIVTDPATTKGLFESMQTDPVTLRQVVDKLPTGHPFRSRLIEGMDAGLFDGGMELGSESDVKTNDPLTLIYKALEKVLDTLSKVVGTQAMADATKKSQSPPNVEPDPKPTPANQPSPPANEPPMSDPTKLQYESRIATLEKKLALTESENALAKAGIEPTEIRIVTLANTPAEHRDKLIESWPKKEVASLQESNGYWPATSPPAQGSGSGDYEDPDFEKKFFEAIKK